MGYRIETFDLILAGIVVAILAAVLNVVLPVVQATAKQYAAAGMGVIGLAAYICLVPRRATKLDLPNKEDFKADYSDIKAHSDVYKMLAKDSHVIRFGKDGPNTKANCPAVTLPQMWLKLLKHMGDKLWLAVERPCPPAEKPGEYELL